MYLIHIENALNHFPALIQSRKEIQLRSISQLGKEQSTHHLNTIWEYQS